MSETPTAPTPPPELASDGERVATVAEWIVNGLRPSQLVREWRRAGWGELEPEDVAAVIGRAESIVAAMARINPEVEHGKAVSRLQDLYARALKNQDYKVALAAQNQLNAMVARLANPFLRPPDATPGA